MARSALVFSLACLLVTSSLAAPWLGYGQRLGQERVINGTDADIADFPWMVAILIGEDEACGASIISSRWVLTAAHCVYVCESELYVDRIKSLRAGSPRYDTGGVLRNITQMIMHPEFSMPTDEDPDVDYDIGVMQAAEPFPFGPTIQPVTLAEDGYDAPAGLPVSLSGWGSTFDDPWPLRLQWAQLAVVDRDVCRYMMADVAPVTPRMVCAGDPARAACHGDSGSPLVHDGVQVGVTSWSRSDCISATAVYADVGNLRGWIRNNTGV